MGKTKQRKPPVPIKGSTGTELADGWPVEQEINEILKHRKPLKVSKRKIPHSVDVITVTPDMAREWISASYLNRSIDKNHVRSLIKEMENGNFAFNGDAYRLDWHGELRDGQHRAFAQAISGISVKTVVITGLDPDVFKTVDQGKKRTVANIIEMEHKEAGNHVKGTTSFIATAIRLVYAVATHRDIYKRIGKHEASDREIAEFEGQHPEILDSDQFIKQCKRGGDPVMGAGVAVALHYIMGRTKSHRKLADKFFEGVYRGEGLKQGSPILALRRLFINQKSKGASLSTKYVIAMTWRAWEAFKKKQKMKGLRFNPEELPTVTMRT